MIYGLNFNRTKIPVEVSARFAKRLALRKGSLVGVGSNQGCAYSLQGVCQTQDELTRMLIQANNSHRRFHVVERHGWIAVYVGGL